MLWVLICAALTFEAIQMSTHNICFYEEVDKSTLVVIYRLLNCLTMLIGTCAVIRSNMVIRQA